MVKLDCIRRVPHYSFYVLGEMLGGLGSKQIFRHFTKVLRKL